MFWFSAVFSKAGPDFLCKVYKHMALKQLVWYLFGGLGYVQEFRFIQHVLPVVICAFYVFVVSSKCWISFVVSLFENAL